MSADRFQELLEKLHRGDEAAAEEIFRTYEPYLRRVVRKQLPAWLRPKFDSQDIVQSTWVDLIKGFREAGWSFPDAEHLRAFLIKSTRNRFIDRLRKNRALGEHQQPLPDDTAHGLAARTERPSELVRAKELWDQMIELCPPAHRDVLLMKRQELPMDEIVARTGLHEDSIRRILRNFNRAFARHVARSAPGHAPGP